MLNQLIDDIQHDQDNELRCIVLSADGPIFSAGHNLKEFTDAAGTRQVFDRASVLMLSILNAPVPVIAKIDGLAAAAGCQLVGKLNFKFCSCCVAKFIFSATCDLVICSDRSSFSTPGYVFYSNWGNPFNL